MTLPNSTRLFQLLGGLLFAFLIYRIAKYRINRLLLARQADSEKKTKRKSDSPEIVPLDELNSKDRTFFERLRDIVYESERWENLLPELKLNPNWRIQPAPPIESEVLRFKIWNKPHDAPAIVAFDPYRDSEDPVWKVFGEDTEPYDVPIDDATQLRAVIASVLQDVSPVKP